MDPPPLVIKQEPLFQETRTSTDDENIDTAKHEHPEQKAPTLLDRLKSEEAGPHQPQQQETTQPQQQETTRPPKADPAKPARTTDTHHIEGITILRRCSLCASKKNKHLNRDAHQSQCKRDVKMHKCPHCEYATPLLNNLKFHYNRRHSTAHREKSLSCHHCDYRTNFKSNLAEHIKRNHWVNYSTYRCSACTYETKLREYLIKHIQRQHPANGDNSCFRCHLCSYRSKYNHHLVQHVQVKHQKRETFSCELCQFQTRCKQYLHKHMKRRHEGPVGCPHCPFLAKCADYLNEHVKKTHWEKWHRKPSNRTRQHDKQVGCRHCSFVTKYPGDLKVHVKTQHDEACVVHSCEHCPYTTKHKGNLFKHYRHKHGAEQFCYGSGTVYACAHCDFKTNFKDCINVHLANSRAAQFSCFECKFKTKCKGYLMFHKEHAGHRVQSICKVFKCDGCDFYGRSKGDVEKHKRKRHREVAQSGFVCTHCGFEAASRQALDNHFECKKVTKDTFRCLECNFVTMCEPYLGMHVENNHIKCEIDIKEEFSYVDFIKGGDIKKEICSDGFEEEKVSEDIAGEAGIESKDVKKELPVVDKASMEGESEKSLYNDHFKLAQTNYDNGIIKMENVDIGFC